MSRILLDTHALLWFVANDAALSAQARALIETADDAFVSVATAWETAIKVQLGKLTVDAPSAEAFFDEQMRANGFTYLPIAPAHVFRAAALPSHHRDPFDRMLIAQAFAEGLVLVTREDFRAYGVATIW
ncbi:MAG: type II toxin-antitoxin system VapC family toxin [Myxococcales bacterium]|nr:type II toxin-antitoxin system VapC family toxin [Myxococcales bacterium]